MRAGECLVLGLWLSAIGCDDKPSKLKAFECRCGFLTDYDDNSEVRVSVCDVDAGKATERATGCAQSGAPAPVQDCHCTATATVGCTEVRCEVKPFR